MKECNAVNFEHDLTQLLFTNVIYIIVTFVYSSEYDHVGQHKF